MVTWLLQHVLTLNTCFRIMKETTKYKNRFLERVVKLIATPFNILILNIQCIYRIMQKSSVWYNILVPVKAAFFIFYIDLSQKSYD